MNSIIPSDYFEIKKGGISPFQTMVAYLGGSAFQTVVDNPVTAYRQLVQQYAKDLNGKTVDPKIARNEVNSVFIIPCWCIFIRVRSSFSWSRVKKSH